MDVTVYSRDGSELREISISDEVFKLKISEGSIWRAIHNEHANARQGNAKTKTRREVKGSTSKPWKQKGTGRARAGRRKSPVWRGGGVVFGPRPGSFNYILPKKIKRLAMKSILSLKAKDSDHFRIIEDFTVESGKTRDLASILNSFPNKGRTVLILSEDDRMTKRAAGNIRDLSYLTFSRLKAHELFYGDNIIIQENAAVKLGEFYGERK